MKDTFLKWWFFFPAEPFKTWSDVIGVRRDIKANMQQIIFDQWMINLV